MKGTDGSDRKSLLVSSTLRRITVNRDNECGSSTAERRRAGAIGVIALIHPLRRITYLTPAERCDRHLGLEALGLRSAERNFVSFPAGHSTFHHLKAQGLASGGICGSPFACCRPASPSPPASDQRPTGKILCNQSSALGHFQHLDPDFDFGRSCALGMGLFVGVPLALC